MNTVSSKQKHIYFRFHEVNPFSFEVNGDIVSLYSEGEFLFIRIQGDDLAVLSGLFFDVISLLFIYIGGFPDILFYKKNNIEEDISRLVSKYKTSAQYKDRNWFICDIDERTLNTDILLRFRRLHGSSVSTLQYLVCDGYEAVITNHKITLLLHVVDGIVRQDLKTSRANFLRREAKSFYHLSISADKLGDYFTRVYYLCKNHFFNYECAYNCEILKLLEKNQYEFLRTLVDTRHWHSHFLDEESSPARLKGGSDIAVYFEIIYLAIRLFVLSFLSVHPNADRVKEYLYSIHDWIEEMKFGRIDSPKSLSYKTSNAFAEFDKKITLIQGCGEGSS